MNSILPVIVLICMSIKLNNALLCYTCTYMDSNVDNSCILDPELGSRITNCTKKYCTIMRQEAVSPAGKVLSFIRDCQDKPQYLNAVKTDPQFKSYYRSCTTDLCNDSDGTNSATNMDPNFGASENMVVKGKDAALSSKYVKLRGILFFSLVMLKIF